MKTYKATIISTISGGNIEVKVTANSISQAVGIIKTLSYFKSFVNQPTNTAETEGYISRISQLTKQAYGKI